MINTQPHPDHDAVETAARADALQAADRPDWASEMPLPRNPQTIFLGGLFVIACFWVMSVAQQVILPVVIAIVLKLLLQPLVRLLGRIRIPRAIGALVAVLVLLGVFVGIGAVLSGPMSEMVRNFPELMQKAQERLGAVEGVVKPVLERLGVGSQSPTEMMRMNPGSVAGSVAGGASDFASHLLETLLILFYMLVFGETFMRRLVEVLPRFGDKKQAVEIGVTVEHDISIYLLTITVINAIVGLLAGTVMWLFGIPGAIVFGVVAFCFNYVPILGPIAGVILFALVGLATLGTTWTALIPAAGYLAIHVTEGEIVTPLILARRFTLNPIAVMVGLIFWYWLWGIQGAILSVPLLAIVKIVSDRLRPFKALGHLLEG